MKIINFKSTLILFFILVNILSVASMTKKKRFMKNESTTHTTHKTNTRKYNENVTTGLEKHEGWKNNMVYIKKPKESKTTNDNQYIVHEKAMLASLGYCRDLEENHRNSGNHYYYDVLKSQFGFEHFSYHIQTRVAGAINKWAYTALHDPKTNTYYFSFSGTTDILTLANEFFVTASVTPFTVKNDDKFNKNALVNKALHEAFKDCVDELKKDLEKIKQTKKDNKKDYILYFTGHSLGGAVASMAALYALKMNFGYLKNIKLVTLGSPRTGNYYFANEVGKLENVERIVNNGDPIASLHKCKKESNDDNSKCINEYGKEKNDMNYNNYQIKQEFENKVGPGKDLIPWHTRGYKSIHEGEINGEVHSSCPEDGENNSDCRPAIFGTGYHINYYGKFLYGMCEYHPDNSSKMHLLRNFLFSAGANNPFTSSWSPINYYTTNNKRKLKRRKNKK